MKQNPKKIPREKVHKKSPGYLSDPGDPSGRSPIFYNEFR